MYWVLTFSLVDSVGMTPNHRHRQYLWRIATVNIGKLRPPKKKKKTTHTHVLKNTSSGDLGSEKLPRSFLFSRSLENRLLIRRMREFFYLVGWLISLCPPWTIATEHM